jgi:hypothetical protein
MYLDTHVHKGACGHIDSAHSNLIDLALDLKITRRGVPHPPPIDIVVVVVEEFEGPVLAVRWSATVHPHGGSNKKFKKLIDLLAQLSWEALEIARRLLSEWSSHRVHDVSRGIGREVHAIRSHCSCCSVGV